MSLGSSDYELKIFFALKKFFFYFNSSRVNTQCCWIEKVKLKRLDEIICVAIANENDDGYLLMWRQRLIHEAGVIGFEELYQSS